MEVENKERLFSPERGSEDDECLRVLMKSCDMMEKRSGTSDIWRRIRFNSAICCVCVCVCVGGGVKCTAVVHTVQPV